MIVKQAGKTYTLETADGYPVVDISFCNRDTSSGKVVDGITNEELVDILIHRMEYLTGKSPKQENINTLTHLKQAKNWMHVRNYNKLKSQKGSHDNTRHGVRVPAEG